MTISDCRLQIADSIEIDNQSAFCILLLFIIFVWVAILALHVAAIIKGLNGGRLIIPGLSEYANRF